MRVALSLLLLICVSILPIGCKEAQAPNPPAEVSTPQDISKALPPPPGASSSQARQ
ncbi:MAG: hypothetical protein ACYC6N_32855 [Pirellulaceae bacterium]